MTKRGGGEWRPFTPSIDRISSSKGYSIGNVRLVTLVAKNGSGEEPLLRLAEALIQKRAEASEQFRNTIRNTSKTKGEKNGAKTLKSLVPRGGLGFRLSKSNKIRYLRQQSRRVLYHHFVAFGKQHVT